MGIDVLVVTVVGLGMVWIGSPIGSSSFSTQSRAPVIDDISCDTMEHPNNFNYSTI
jgi:hypothetical protein